VKDSPTTRHYWYLWDSLEITDELLFKKFHRKDGVESYNQFIVPLRLRKEILKNMHDSVISGHLGKKTTLIGMNGKWTSKSTNNFIQHYLSTGNSSLVWNCKNFKDTLGKRKLRRSCLRDITGMR
jgi:hypothetical protein